MAEVHRATRRLADGTEIEVGLKRLHRHLLDNPRAVEEFVEEARIASLMEHENICRFYEAGRLEESYFIAMEYIRGRDLGSMLKEARKSKRVPPLSVVLTVLCQLCDALEYAHNRADQDSGAPLGFVHRDISPANILVTSDGQVKVIDLGIALAKSRAIRTDQGVIKGKFGYIAPEVLSGSRADRRADIFAVGVVGWELLTAEPLFTGETDLDTLDKIRIGAIDPPSSRRATCPPQLDEVVMRALARCPRERWPTAAALRTALRALAATMHEPISSENVAQWLTGPERVPIPITRENSDAITLVRQRTPRTIPSAPARFPLGTKRLPRLEADPRAVPVIPQVVSEAVPEAVPEAIIETVPVSRRVTVTEEEQHYRALAMLGGGLLTTAVIATLMVARSCGDQDTVRSALAFPTLDVLSMERAPPSSAEELAAAKLPADAPELPADASALPADAPEVLADAPELPADAPALSVDPSELPSEAPTVPAAAPERLADASAPPNNSALPSPEGPDPPDRKTPESGGPEPADSTARSSQPSAEPAEEKLGPIPLEVKASAVQRLSGDFPRSRGSRARYRARLCINQSGKVASVEITAGPERLYRRITRHLRRWRYRPYHQDDAPMPACFEVEHHLLPWQ